MVLRDCLRLQVLLNKGEDAVNVTLTVRFSDCFFDGFPADFGLC